MTQDYAILGVFVIVGIAFVAVTLVSSRILGRQRPSPAKGSTYERGVLPIGPPWVRFRIGNYVYVLMFAVFVIGAVFMYLWAVVFQRMGALVLVQMTVFAGILALGLLYAWKEGALTWR